MSLRYYFKIKSHLNNRAHQQIIPPTDRLLFCNKQMTPPFRIRTRISIEKLSIVQTPVLPEFSSRILNITIPTWHTISPEINVELSEYTKEAPIQHSISKNFNVLLVKNFKIIYSYTLTVAIVPLVLVPPLCVIEIVRWQLYQKLIPSSVRNCMLSSLLSASLRS